MNLAPDLAPRMRLLPARSFVTSSPFLTPGSQTPSGQIAAANPSDQQGFTQTFSGSQAFHNQENIQLLTPAKNQMSHSRVEFGTESQIPDRFQAPRSFGTIPNPGLTQSLTQGQISSYSPVFFHSPQKITSSNQRIIHQSVFAPQTNSNRKDYVSFSHRDFPTLRPYDILPRPQATQRPLNSNFPSPLNIPYQSSILTDKTNQQLVSSNSMSSIAVESNQIPQVPSPAVCSPFHRFQGSPAESFGSLSANVNANSNYHTRTSNLPSQNSSNFQTHQENFYVVNGNKIEMSLNNASFSSPMSNPTRFDQEFPVITITNPGDSQNFASSHSQQTRTVTGNSNAQTYPLRIRDEETFSSFNPSYHHSKVETFGTLVQKAAFQNQFTQSYSLSEIERSSNKNQRISGSQDRKVAELKKQSSDELKNSKADKTKEISPKELFLAACKMDYRVRSRPERSSMKTPGRTKQKRSVNFIDKHETIAVSKYIGREDAGDS